MKTVEQFILGLDGQQKAIVSYFHRHLSSTHDLQSKINWNIPAYYRKSWICYLNPIKNEGIELAFFRGRELSNEQALLNSKDRKLVSGIDFYSIQQINIQLVDEIIQEAIILDDLHKS